MTGLTADSRANPARLLQFDLTFECFGKIDDEKLDEAAGQSYTRKYVEIAFSPDSDDFNAAGGPDLLRG